MIPRGKRKGPERKPQPGMQTSGEFVYPFFLQMVGFELPRESLVYTVSTRYLENVFLHTVTDPVGKVPNAGVNLCILNHFILYYS
jgi:hypothetical protein